MAKGKRKRRASCGRKGIQTSEYCCLVRFKRRGGGVKEVERCVNRSLRASARRSFERRLRQSEICWATRNGQQHGGKRYKRGQFIPC